MSVALLRPMVCFGEGGRKKEGGLAAPVALSISKVPCFRGAFPILHGCEHPSHSDGQLLLALSLDDIC